MSIASRADAFGGADRFEVKTDVMMGGAEYTVMEDSESVFQLGLQDESTVDETTDFRFVIPAFTAIREAPDGDSIGFALRASRKKEMAGAGSGGVRPFPSP